MSRCQQFRLSEAYSDRHKLVWDTKWTLNVSMSCSITTWTESLGQAAPVLRETDADSDRGDGEV